MSPEKQATEILNKFGTKEKALLAIELVINFSSELGQEMFKKATDSYSSRCVNSDKKQYWINVKTKLENL